MSPITSLLELFCEIDDFWQAFEPSWYQTLLESGQRRRACRMSMSEMMTIVIHFHQKRFRDFKTYYTDYVATHLRAEFPTLLSYTRLIQLLDELGKFFLRKHTIIKRIYDQLKNISQIEHTRHRYVFRS